MEHVEEHSEQRGEVPGRASSFEVRPAGAAPYAVLSGREVPAQVCGCARGRRQVVVVADDNTQARYAEPIATALQAAGHGLLSLQLPAGDAHKSRAQKARLEDNMLGAGIDRQALMVAVGGGVVCDLVGFVAATYMRGIAHLNVATTLLCQVDAAIGGKTAINLPEAKNAIGAFHHPRTVIMHHDALATLPDDELRTGLAEAIKQAALSGDGLFDELLGWLRARSPDARPEPALVMRCAAVKAEVVAEDALDHGVRQLLNFGHTVGHALERAGDHALRHGDAVAIGMLVEARAAARRGRFPEADVARLREALEAAGLPIAPPYAFADAWPFMKHDKKNRDSAVHMAVPPQIGSRQAQQGQFTQAVSAAELEQVWG